ncbi:MAG: hypothetical protein U0800_22735 [Isosphaeraceae bacterium]
MACVLRAFGAGFDVDGFLTGSPFRPCAVFRRGQPRTSASKRLCEQGGFHLEVSPEEGDCVPAQVRDATAFVASHRAELERLAAWPGVESVRLDFSWDFPRGNVAGQWNLFPSALLAACGALRVDIIVSVYSASNGEGEGAD